MKITPAMMKALTAPMPNFHDTWRRYASSQFRQEWLKTWAGDDPDKLRAVDELLAEQPRDVR